MFNGKELEMVYEPGVEVFARIRVELMASGEEERQALAVFERIEKELALYRDQECEFDR